MNFPMFTTNRRLIRSWAARALADGLYVRDIGPTSSVLVSADREDQTIHEMAYLPGCAWIALADIPEWARADSERTRHRGYFWFLRHDLKPMRGQTDIIDRLLYVFFQGRQPMITGVFHEVSRGQKVS